jgi:uncharacterized protein YjbJ (UPF0337 family)
MNKDQVKGRVEEVKGKVKEVAGNLVGNKSLEAKGIVQKNAGKIQAGCRARWCRCGGGSAER